MSESSNGGAFPRPVRGDASPSQQGGAFPRPRPAQPQPEHEPSRAPQQAAPQRQQAAPQRQGGAPQQGQRLPQQGQPTRAPQRPPQQGGQHPQGRPPQGRPQGPGYPPQQAQSPQQRPQQGPPRQAQPQQRPQPQQGPSAPSPSGQQTADLFGRISDSRLTVIKPEEGFRGALYRMTNGRVNLGLSPAEQCRADLIRSIQATIHGNVRHVVVWSQKGGAGKTTTATRLGATLATHRTDSVLALDVNPDGGSLAVKVPQTTQRTILDLRDALRSGYVSPSDFDLFVNHAAHRLDSIVLPPGKKVNKRDVLTGDDYLMISRALQERYPYRIIVTDCGTNLSDSVMDGVLKVADQLVVLAPATVDEGTVAAGGLEALMESGYSDLVSNAVTVMVDKVGRVSDVGVQRKIDKAKADIRSHFESLTHEIVSMPFDPSLFFGGVYDPETVSAESRLAELELASAVVKGLVAQDHA